MLLGSDHKKNLCYIRCVYYSTLSIIIILSDKIYSFNGIVYVGRKPAGRFCAIHPKTTINGRGSVICLLWLLGEPPVIAASCSRVVSILYLPDTRIFISTQMHVISTFSQ